MNATERILAQTQKVQIYSRKFDPKAAEKALKEARRILNAYAKKHGPFSLVDDLIATRRAEAASEE